MKPEQVKALVEALKNGDADAALAIAEQMLVDAASGGAAAEGGTPEALAEGADPKPPTPEEEAGKAAMAELKKLTGKGSAGEVVQYLSTIVKDVEQIKANAAKLELSERRALVGDLVKLGAEVPATAWAGKPEDLTPAKRLADEPIESLRERVALLRKAGPARAKDSPPETSTAELSKEEQATADSIKDLAARARYVALRLSRKG
jgi:hypothetical protein